LPKILIWLRDERLARRCLDGGPKAPCGKRIAGAELLPGLRETACARLSAQGDLHGAELIVNDSYQAPLNFT
jgi:hypothetical protein